MLEVLKECRELALPRGGEMNREMLLVAGVPGSQLGYTEALGRAACQLPLKAFFGILFESLRISVEVCSWYDPLAFAKPLCLGRG